MKTGPLTIRWFPAPFACGVLLAALLPGCGTTLSRTATEQLLSSDALDRSIAEIDFHHFAGEKVYLDSQYLTKANGTGVVNSDYVISSLRQQIMSAGCLLQEKKEDAEYIIEARVGTLGTNSHEVTYGIPANNLLTAASSLVPMMPTVPTMPEISVAKRHDQFAAAKVGAFAYHRETREPVWQSGISLARSKAKDTWVMGAGPFQSGTIYGGTQFAGERLGLAWFSRRSQANGDAIAAYHQEKFFAHPAERTASEPKQLADEKSGEEQSEPAQAAKPAEIERTSHEEPAAEPEKTAPVPLRQNDGWTNRGQADDRIPEPATSGATETDGTTTLDSQPGSATVAGPRDATPQPTYRRPRWTDRWKRWWRW